MVFERSDSEFDEAKMVGITVISGFIIFSILQKICRILKDSIQLSIGLALFALFIYLNPETTEEYIKYGKSVINRYLPNYEIPEIMWESFTVLKRTLRFSLLFVADRIRDFAFYLK